MTWAAVENIKDLFIIVGIVVSLLAYFLNKKSNNQLSKHRSIDYCINSLKIFKESEFIKEVIIKENTPLYSTLTENNKIEFQELLCYMDDLGYMKKERMVESSDLVYLFGWYIKQFMDLMDSDNNYKEFPEFNNKDWKYCREFMEETLNYYESSIK
jgi:hypothetical protein